MKTLFIAIFTLVASTTFSQELVTWKGGTPGAEDRWDVAKNWSNNRVPDEFSDVIIADVSSTTRVYPVIRYGEFEVNSLQLVATAMLEIQKDALLTILNDPKDLIQGKINIEGWIYILPSEAESNFADITPTIPNK